ncbi:HD family phosphohydrolase [Flavobacterium sp. NRK1]|uniref:HD domain-containing protein n=1 Tax=Flavobacterium sp. NRK1 TaxID=2954929 RepID=UPI002093B0CA|nr:HD family phosphohydrolase [Flavobacterium sp. NRK1]MCO6148071.1 HD family phosphohydrolase [Flavobacterium sp. NRK1]
MIDIEKVKLFIINKLEKELPSGLYYHNVRHILDVYDTVIRHAAALELSAQDTLLLKTAALFHDSGFIIKAKGHEEISCSYAEEYLPLFGYSEEQVKIICGMIMATKIPQSPHTGLEEIIADADLDYLGRDDFFEISDCLYRELLNSEVVKNEKEWNALQVDFFEKHHYFTSLAKELRDGNKEKHLKIIKSKITKHT